MSAANERRFRIVGAPVIKTDARALVTGKRYIPMTWP